MRKTLLVFFVLLVAVVSMAQKTYAPGESTANKVTAFSSPTDAQYPSAKLVNDQLALKQPLILTGTTSSIGGGILAAGACATGTVSITGATTSMTAIASPAGGVDPTNGGVLGVAIDARVSSANTVTVSVCSPIAGTPAAANYNVRVIQ